MYHVQRKLFTIGVILTMMLVGTLIRAQPEELVVWHALGEQEAEFLGDYTAEYEEREDVAIELVQFNDLSELNQSLITGAAAGEVPDVFFAPHTLQSELIDAGLIGAYCTPDQCQECRGPNPPRWCIFATGRGFEDLRIEGLTLGTAYCLPGQCPQCESENPPRWCRFASGEIDAQIDIVKVPFLVWFDSNWFPRGIPWWWWYHGFFQNVELAEEIGIETPEGIDQAIEIAQEFGIYTDVPELLPFEGMENLRLLDNPEEAALLFTNTSQLPELQNQLGEIKPFAVQGYQPQLMVYGGYMTMQSEQRDLALDYLYYLLDDDEQVSLHMQTGHLPASGPALEMLAEMNPTINSLIETAQDVVVTDDEISGPIEEADVRIVPDQIGIVLAEGASPERLTRFVNQFDLERVERLNDNLFIYQFPDEVGRQTINEVAATLREEGEGIIAQAGLVAFYPGQTRPVFITNEVIVQFREGVSEEEIDEFNEQNALRVLMPNPYVENQFLVAAEEDIAVDALELAERYRTSGLVEFAEPNAAIAVEFRQEVIPNDTFFGNQWHHRNTGQSGGQVDADVDTSWAWDITRGNANTLIAVIDSGFTMNHPDYQANIWTNPGEIAGDGLDNDGNGFTDDINGWDFTGCTSTSGPGCGDNNPTGGNHGTAVAGSVAAVDDNNLGVVGSCPNCQIMLIRLGNTFFSHALAFGYAQNNGAAIITNSWGYNLSAGTTAVQNAINNAANNGRGGLGSVVLFAMVSTGGGFSEDCLTPGQDISALPSVIAVSASNNRDRRTPAGYGDCMDVVAPTDSSGTTGTLWAVTTDVTGTNGYNNTAGSPSCPSAEPAPPPNSDRDYTFCFGGTSFATPLTAGATGLMLSERPNLTRQQVQFLLQDTADKVEDSAANYDGGTGYSQPTSGPAGTLPAASTHGYGRVNAWEAVRVAAPREDGGREGVDIFLRDNPLDWGNTTGYEGEQASNVLFESPRGFIGHWNSVDIKVDAPPYTMTPPTTPAAFEAFVHENPIGGEINRVYVRVRNRGPVTASAVTVKLHWGFAGTALPPLPSDFWTQFPNDSSDTSVWHPLGTQTIDSLSYSGASAAGCPGRAAPACPGGVTDQAQIVSFDWTAPVPDLTVASPRHYCLFAVIDSPDDPVDPRSEMRLAPDSITPNDNNVTHRNVTVLDPGRGPARLVFYVRNPFDFEIETMLQLELSDPERMENWDIELAGIETELNLDKPFSLVSGEEHLVQLDVAPANDNSSGVITVNQLHLMEGGELIELLGGISFEMGPEFIGKTGDIIFVPRQPTVLWLNHFDLLAGDPSVQTSFNAISSGVGSGLTGLVVESTSLGDTSPQGGNKVVHMAVDVPPDYRVRGVRVCYELWNTRSYITQVRLAQVRSTPSAADVLLDDGTDLNASGPVCVNIRSTDIDPVNGPLLLSLRVNFNALGDRIVIRGLGLLVERK